MWDWFKRRMAKNQSSVEPQAAVSVTMSTMPDEFHDINDADEFTVEDIYNAIKLFFYAVKPRIYYAKMQGVENLPYSLEVITNEDFMVSLLNKDDSILSVNEERAFEGLMLRLDSIFHKGGSDEVRVYLQHHPRHDLLERLTQKWPEQGVVSFIASEKESIRSRVKDYVCFCKLADDIEIMGKLTSKLEFIVPIFKNSMTKGMSRYGDQGYSFFYEECRIFVSEFFDRDDLKFYSPSDAWVSVANSGSSLLDS